MKDSIKVSNHFRKELKQELQIWQSDGIITPGQSTAINQRYMLDQTAGESRNIVLSAIYIIGAVLVAAGVISFVAAHWDKITPSVKIAVIISFMLACHLSGFYLWKISGKSPRLGHALITLGTLVFGANIGLLAQIFHIEANFYNGMYAWAIGALVMAYALESEPNIIIAVIVSFIAFCGWIADDSHSFCYYPFVAAAVVLPFAYLHRSVITFAFSLLAVAISVMVYAAWDSSGLFGFSIAAAGVGLFCFAYGLLSNRTNSFKIFAPPAMVFAVPLAAMNAYMLSFEESAREVKLASIKAEPWTILVAVVYIIAVLMWIYVFKSMLSDRRLRPISISMLVSTILLLSGIIIKIFPQGSRADNDYFSLIITANIACLALCVGLIINSYRAENRGIFWAGILLTALIITSRFLEYETDLLLKAAVFTGCGIGLILAGVSFENYLKKRRLINE
ncbi:MAG: DUF2157 domain-containing protein [Phycisphaerae bacterium]|nr:DUF2157 domain-containing protein [Phycisphaerae bacterium]MDD5380163.1 DUF2157 domain-containing protein [Phycisphaerae bacterium]